jgi:hypothetical protein
MGDWGLAWKLPGHAEPTNQYCGTRRFFSHSLSSGGSHWRVAKLTCGRFACRVCALEPGGWASREAKAISHRVSVGAAFRRRKVIHVVVSPPQDSDYRSVKAYTRLRTEAYRVAVERGFDGGCAIFHAKRMGSSRFNSGRSLGCRDGPHWHLLGTGWITSGRCVHDIAGTQEFCKHLGKKWVVKNLGVRKTVRGTASYLLSHASQGWTGILPHSEALGMPTEAPGALQVVTWFGTMRFGKGGLKCARPEPVGAFCRYCRSLIPLKEWTQTTWEGQGPPPEGEFGVCTDGDWRAIAPSRWGRE